MGKEKLLWMRIQIDVIYNPERVPPNEVAADIEQAINDQCDFTGIMVSPEFEEGLVVGTETGETPEA